MKKFSPKFILPLFLLCYFYLPKALTAAIPNELPSIASAAAPTFYAPAATITPALTSAEDFCTDPTDLGTCGSSIPGDPNTITAGPGEPLYITYEVTNTGQSDIVNSVVDDSQFGDDVASSGFTFTPGQTVIFRILANAPTVIGTYNVTATYTGTDAGGNTVVATGTYTIIVPEPMATITPALTSAEDFCTDPTDLGTCGSSIPGDPNTITAGPGEPLYITYRVTNTGQSDIVNSVVDDSQFGDDVASSGFTFTPGQTVIFRILANAPTVIGTYNVTATYTGTDAGGNTVVTTGTYTIIVPEPMATINPALTSAEDFCTDPTDLGTCGSSIPGDPNTITAGPGEPLYITYRVTNTGQSDIVNSVVDDSQFGDDVASSGFTFTPGQTVIFRILANAPTVIGTYNVTATYTGTDAGGNTVVATGTYTIIVPEPMATITPALTSAEDFCTDPTDLGTCGSSIPGDPNTITAGPGEPLYITYRVTNTGQSDIVNSVVDDSQFGDDVASSGFTFTPGQTVIFRILANAPTAPGIYNVTATYTGTDAGGNTVSTMGTYTIIIEGPNANFQVLLGDGDDFCTDDTNIATCSSLPASAPNTITLVQNEPYLLEYAVESTGTTDIIQHEVTDDALGNVVNTSSPTLAPGQNTRFPQLLTAPSTPGTYTIQATYEGTDGNGTNVVRTASYTLEVLNLDVNFNVAIANAASICPDPNTLSGCGFLFPDMTNVASVPPGAPVYLEYQVTEAGEVPVVLHTVIDDQYGTVIANDPFDITSTGNRQYRALQNAPVIPGIYDFTASYTGEDADGNPVMREATYTLIVGCPEECFIQGPSGTVCPGTYEFTADYDATICTSPTVNWIVTDAAGGTQTYTGNPVAIDLDGCAEDYTIESTVSCADCPEPAVCTTTLRTEDTTPPEMECTTVEVNFDACPDGFGPNFTNGEWLPIGPTGIYDAAFGGVFTFPVDLNNCLSDNCTDLADIEYTLNDSYIESSVPGCSLTLISEIRFRDKCGNIAPNILILRGTIEESNPSPPTVNCPADMTVPCTASTDPSATGMATGSNDCGDVIISFTDASLAGCGNTEVITRTWTATNGCGQQTSCEQIITVESVTPTIACPADITIDCTASNDPSNTGTATGEDPCGGTVMINSDDVFVAGCSAATGTITRTWTVTNECGLSTSCDQIITIVDETPPVFDLACQLDITYTTENGAVCPADATISLNEGDELTVNDGWTVGGNAILSLSGCVSDDCSTDAELTITVDDITITDDGTCSRVITVTFLADDGCGNVSDPFVCNYTFIDNTGPEVSFNGIPDGGTYVVECDLPSTTWDPLIDIGELTITDNCSAIDFAGITEVLTQLYDGPCVGNLLTRWQQVFTVQDVCGNTTVYTLFTEIIDTTPPVFNASPADVTIECDETAPVPQLEAFDSCSEVIYNFNEVRTDGDCPNNYTLTRTWLASDGCGNTSVETQIVTVEDTTPPVIEFVDEYVSDYTPGQDVFIECSEYGNISLIIASAAAAFDNCSGGVPTTYDLQDLGGFDCAEFGYSGHLISTWKAVDECGNESVATINWFLVDETAPTFQGLPEDVCASLDNLPPVADVQAVDDCELAVLTFSQSDPIDCDGGQYIERTWNAEDACGNTNSYTQRISLNGTSGPTITIDYPEIGDVMDGDLVQLPVDCDQDIAFSVEELEAAISMGSGCGSGSSSTELTLMDEGDCQENGYFARYNLSVMATDACGNTNSLSITIDFVDMTPPVVAGPAEITLNCGDEIPSPMAEDACGEIASMTFVDSAPIETSCPDNPVAYDRTWTVTDDCGNTTTFVQSIIVLDNDGPVFSGVPADMCNNTGIDVVVTAVDGCTGNQAQVFFDEVMSSESGCGEVLTRTWTATDACGNTSVATQQVFFDDNEAPEIEFTSDLLFGLESGDELFLTVGDGLGDPGDPLFLTADDVTVTDNCAALSAEVLVETTLSDDCAADGYLARYDYKFIATDPCGNISSAGLTVFYVDNNAPDFFNVPANTEVFCTAVPAVADVTASDDYDESVEVIFSETQTATADGVLITRTWTATDKCGNTKAVSQEILVVNNDLDATFSFGSPVIECNSDNNRLGVTPTGGTPPYTYAWELTFPEEDGYITTDPTRPAILFTMGYITQTFTVLITDANGCEYAASVTVVCDFSDDEGDFTGGGNDQLSLNVYPNPTSEQLMVRAGGLADTPVTVAMYNLFGQELFRQKLDTWMPEGMTIDTRRFPNGTYVLRLTADGHEVQTREVVILH